MNISRIAAMALVSASALALTACGQNADTTPTTNATMNSDQGGAMSDTVPGSGDALSANSAMSDGAMMSNEAGAVNDSGAMSSGDAMQNQH